MAWRVAKEDKKLCVAVVCLKLMIIFNGTSLGISDGLCRERIGQKSALGC